MGIENMRTILSERRAQTPDSESQARGVSLRAQRSNLLFAGLRWLRRCAPRHDMTWSPKRSIRAATAFRSLRHWSFGFVSDFEFRISDFPRSSSCALVVLAILMALAPVSWSAPDADEPSQQIYDQTVNSFVVVSYHLKKSDRPYIDSGSRPEYGQQTVLQYILNKNTLDVVGVIVSDQGEVFTFEKEPAHHEVVERITIKGPGGIVVPAQADRLLVKAPGRILRIEGALPAGWKPLAFTECPEITPQTKLFAAAMGSDKYYRMYIKGCEYGRNWDNGIGSGDCLRISGMYSVAVLCNDEGRPVGVTCLSEIDLGPGGPAWRGKDILADPGLSDEQHRRLEEEMRTEFGRSIYEVRILPRPTPQEEEELDFGGRSRFRGRYSGQRDTPETLLYGLGFADDKLLIPEALPKEFIAGIDTITVTVDDENLPARFVGVLKDCSAMVIELEKGKLPQTTPFPADARLARVEPFWAVYARELAGKDVRMEFTRWIDKQQGYADLWYPTAERAVPTGSWLLDRMGNLIGFCGEARHEHDRLEFYLLGADQDRYRPYGPSSAMRARMMAMMNAAAARYASNARLIDAAEMAKMLTDLPAHCDPHIRHLDKDEQKRRVWLGVEYTGPDKEMIKHMGLREPTRDGQIGLMVNRVYEGSPAAKMGLTEGDILLKIAVPGTPWPIELTSLGGDDSGLPDFDEADIPREFAAMGYQRPRRRPWPSRDNYLTQLLADVGRDTTVKLTYLHGAETVEKEFTIEQSPRDMLSAAKYKNDQLGLTVKDVTYEVRAALRLKPDEPAVVVTKVEQGTPAALARINTFELIRAVDGATVDSVETLEKLIAEAQKARKDSVRVTVEWMGKTRLADIKFEARAPAGNLLNPLLPER